MKSDFLLAITQLSAEKRLPREVVLAAVESALVSAYRKDNFAANQNISVKIDPATGRVDVWAEKAVVDSVSDARGEVSLAEAKKIKADTELGQTVMVKATPSNAGRIAAQTAKQVILQRLHEAEHSAIFEEYAGKEGDIISGIVQRMEPGQIFLDLGRTEAVLPANEQVRTEKYRLGQRLKVYLLEIAKGNRGPQIVVSRSHPRLLQRLFELEVPEVASGVVEIKTIAREAGFRSKVAVAARQEGIDPVGCCVGLRGIRIQNIVNELSGEKIDVVLWSPSPAAFIANALSPAQAQHVELSEAARVATVVIQDRQLSLAIGREGQNVRLAAKLTEWRIDIKSASAVEAERLARLEALAETKEAAVLAEPPAERAVEPPPAPAEVRPEVAAPPEPQAVVPVTPEKPTAGRQREVRFAEELAVPQAPKPEAKQPKKKKGPEREGEGATRLKRRKLELDIMDEEAEYK